MNKREEIISLDEKSRDLTGEILQNDRKSIDKLRGLM
jgi:hypothetical protein